MAEPTPGALAEPTPGALAEPMPRAGIIVTEYGGWPARSTYYGSV